MDLLNLKNDICLKSENNQNFVNQNQKFEKFVNFQKICDEEFFFLNPSLKKFYGKLFLNLKFKICQKCFLPIIHKKFLISKKIFLSDSFFF